MTDALPARTSASWPGSRLPTNTSRRLADDISTAAATPALPDDLLDTADRAVTDVHDYLDGLITDRRRARRKTC